jgi:prenyltransferase beta subunit
VNNPSANIPIYRQMIDLLHNAISLLDEQGREEALQFLLSQQNPDGGIKDRGGKSDLYYSLFGGLMLTAFGKWKEEKGKGKGEREEDSDSKFTDSNPQLVTRNPQLVEDSILKLSQFVARYSLSKIPGFIEQCCLVLLQKELKSSRTSRIRNLVSLGRSFSKERYSINLSYRSFVLFLTLEAIFPFRRILNMGIRKMLARTTVDANSPCSEVAAKVFIQKMMNQNGTKEQELLKKFACDTGGFKAFLQLQKADMLSTAVALFALNYAQCDLRLLKPVCLEFIGQNFADGAFLSGDGDPAADVEYTFYGLLALGLLAE